MSDAIEHEQARALLPWLVNGTLTGEELERVERHVRDCVPCRAELKEQRALHALVRRHPAVHVSAEQGFERLRRRLDAATPHPAGARVPIGRRRSVRFAAAAALVAAVAGAALSLSLPLGRSTSDAPSYSVLADAPADSAQIDIVFEDAVTEQQMRALLAEIDGTIVAGPSRLGRYTVRLESGHTGDDEMDALIRRLLQDSRVRFAGRAFSPVVAPEGAR